MTQLHELGVAQIARQIRERQLSPVDLVQALLERIETPTLLIAGGADLSAPPPLQRFYTARIKNSESLIVPNAGHSTYWEQPEIFNWAVLEFIRKH